MPALPSARVPYKRVRMFRILFSQKDLLWNFQYEYKQQTFWLTKLFLVVLNFEQYSDTIQSTTKFIPSSVINF